MWGVHSVLAAAKGVRTLHKRLAAKVEDTNTSTAGITLLLLTRLGGLCLFQRAAKTPTPKKKKKAPPAALRTSQADMFDGIPEVVHDRLSDDSGDEGHQSDSSHDSVLREKDMVPLVIPDQRGVLKEEFQHKVERAGRSRWQPQTALSHTHTHTPWMC